MQLRLHTLLMGTAMVAALGPQGALSADFWKNKKPSEWSESEASKLLSQSPWAKRTKIRSTMSGDPSNLPGLPGTEAPGVGVIGPNGTVLSPTTSDIMNRQLAGEQPMPCLGWSASIGSMGSGASSPTSDECKAAWKSVSAAKGEGSLRDAVIVLWESAAPVRDAKVRLGINDPVKAQAGSAFIVSLIGYPLMIDPSQGAMKPIIRDSAVLLHKGRGAVHASDVAFIETGSTIIRFFYQRREAMKPGDKEVVFRFQMGTTLVEAKFDLKEMVYRGEPAL